MCKPFMDKESYENMVIRTNSKDLSKYIDSKNLLKEWGGELEFDINK